MFNVKELTFNFILLHILTFIKLLLKIIFFIIVKIEYFSYTKNILPKCLHFNMTKVVIFRECIRLKRLLIINFRTREFYIYFSIVKSITYIRGNPK